MNRIANIFLWILMIFFFVAGLKTYGISDQLSVPFFWKFVSAVVMWVSAALGYKFGMEGLWGNKIMGDVK